MSGGEGGGNWRQKTYQALALVLLVALGARLAADLLEPLVPVLLVLGGLWALYWFIFGRRH